MLPPSALALLPERTYARCVVGGMAATLAACYALSLAKGDVPLWPAPMVSDCFVPQPQSFLSRVGLCGGGVAAAGCVWTFGACVQRAARASGASSLAFERGVRWAPRLGYAAFASLALVGACNEDELVQLHGTAAVLFFACFAAYMYLSSLQCGVLQLGTRQQRAWRSRLGWGFVAAVLVAVVAAVLQGVFKRRGGGGARSESVGVGRCATGVAVAEWVGVACILAVVVLNEDTAREAESGGGGKGLWFALVGDESDDGGGAQSGEPRGNFMTLASEECGCDEDGATFE